VNYRFVKGAKGTEEGIKEALELIDKQSALKIIDSVFIRKDLPENTWKVNGNHNGTPFSLTKNNF